MFRVCVCVHFFCCCWSKCVCSIRARWKSSRDNKRSWNRANQQMNRMQLKKNEEQSVHTKVNISSRKNGRETQRSKQFPHPTHSLKIHWILVYAFTRTHTNTRKKKNSSTLWINAFRVHFISIAKWAIWWRWHANKRDEIAKGRARKRLGCIFKCRCICLLCFGLMFFTIQTIIKAIASA